MNLNNKCIVITGASSGIGEELFKLLLAYENVKIVIAAKSFEKYDNKYENVFMFEGDLSQKDVIDSLFDFAINKMGRIDLFFANAGFAYYEKIENADFMHIDKIYKTNVLSPIYSIEKMYELNREREYKVVVTSSSMGFMPMPGYSLYGSTKSAINSFIKGYRYEIDDPKKISVLYPIATKTKFFNRAGSNVPNPFPVQTSSYVAKCTIKGVLKDKKSIYPSRIFLFFMILDRVFPFSTEAYTYVQKKKFVKWLKTK